MGIIAREFLCDTSMAWSAILTWKFLPCIRASRNQPIPPQRESADQFQPVVVTYLHFYAPRDKGFRWGGTFGAGIPVGGDNSKLNIMLGLSTFLGKNDPVCITAGVTGTQIKKLSGWKTGDKTSFTQLTSNNYNSVYRAGYFLALTFNPSNLNMKD